MKALLVASPKADAQPVEELLRSRGSDVVRVDPSEVVPGASTGCALAVLLASGDEDDFSALAAVCRALKTSGDGGPLVLALARRPAHLEVFCDEGADDFTAWPGDEELLGTRLELLFRRVSQRSRDAVRTAVLADAVRQAERSEQRFRHLAESSTEILARLSPGGVRLYISPACRSVLGYEPDELLGSSIIDMLHPADVSKLLEARQALDAGASAAGAIIRLQRKDGEYAWLETISRPVRDPRTEAIEEIVTVSRDVTSSIYAEQDKISGEERFEMFAVHAPVGIFQADTEGRCLFINPRACEIADLTPSQAAGHGWTKLFDQTELEAFQDDCPVTGAARTDRGREVRIRLSNGQVRWIVLNATEVRDENGEVTGYLGTVLDVTRERRAREALVASEERFRAMVEDATDLVCRCRPDGTLTFVNAAYCRTFGKRAEQLVGERYQPLIPEEDRAGLEEELRSLSPERPVVTTEHRVILPGGELRWLQWYDQGFFDDQGNLVEILSTGRDVTDRRRLQEELADARDFLRDVIDAVPDPICVKDDAGHYIMVNRAFCALLGRPREEVVGRTAAEIWPASQRAEAASRTEQEGEREETITGADGSVRVLSERRAVLTGREGRRVLVSVMRDVTERKRIEAQLVLSDRMVSLGTLAAGIAHEINNPLSYVIGNLSFVADAIGELRRDALPEGLRADELNQALAESLEGARRIGAIVRDMKVFSRSDTETLGPVDVPRVLETSMRMVRNALEHRARLVRAIGEVPLVMGNEARLGQVFVNLLTNAMQSLPDREPTENEVRVSARSERGEVVVEVRDNGQGIAKEALRHIFDPFFTTKAVGEGMGLGLSICQGIVAGLGGRIEVESEVGQGTLFRVIMPAAPTSPGRSSDASGSETPSTRTRERILVVDDEPSIGAAVRRMLPEHDVHAVTSAKEALERLSSGERYAAVLCDLIMPGMTGMDLFLELASKAPEVSRRMGFLTGGAFTPAAKSFLDGLPGRFLDKPFDAPSLRKFVERLAPAS
ncbi:PAS domain-containing hybrid sensor histidine kinase/response regulator [Polyangium aurulentum]|uniref:PAS domain-containing hybrid sensor histidine kinase/response regulator n=1 Tax=Polyangium aurulentum TaxID=2567896 RepID=UPI001469CD92|nr:PAS domain S-box protein [Polyangium aurulentum]UQA56560.1 PAS domain S-box protein [Polyangium aurulentum]